jgi:hypothetical protein
VAGGGPGIPPWLVTKGWADVDRGELLGPAHRWPAYCGSVLPVAVPVKILAFVIWLFGLIAVVRLWQATSTAYFKAPRP